MTDDRKSTSWWHTLPGMLTALAGVITAVTGLIVAFNNIGLFKNGDDAALQANAAEAGSSVLPRADPHSKASAGSLAPPAKLTSREAAAHSIDNPLPLAVGTTYKLTLADDEETFFRFTAPAGDLKVIVDMQPRPRERGVLSSALSLLDADGAVVEDNIIFISEADIGARGTKTLGLKPGSVAGLKLLNKSKLADVWLTVLPERTNQFVPFYGEIVPTPFTVGQSLGGSLEPDEQVYYAASFGRGEYKVVMDFVSSDKKQTVLSGELALRDADGGNHRQLIVLSQYAVSHRMTKRFSVTKDQLLIIRVANTGRPANYSVRIVPAT